MGEKSIYEAEPGNLWYFCLTFTPNDSNVTGYTQDIQMKATNEGT